MCHIGDWLVLAIMIYLALLLLVCLVDFLPDFTLALRGVLRYLVLTESLFDIGSDLRIIADSLRAYIASH